MADYKHAIVRDGKGGYVVFPPFVTQNEIDFLSDQFVVRDDDVYIVTYPRSGTTWMEQIVHLLANNGEQGNKVLSEAVPWLEGAANRYGGLDKFISGICDRRYFHSHLPYTLMPEVNSTYAKYIYVARNPKDNAVSFYYHSRSKMGYEGTWEEFFHLYIEGKVGYGLVFEHILDWWYASQISDHIMFIKYEDMHKDLGKIVIDVAQFIGIPLDSTLLSSVIKQSAFTSMATNTKANLDWVPQREGVPKHMRKGIIGDWQNHFTSEQNAVFDVLYREKLAGTGLVFDFSLNL